MPRNLDELSTLSEDWDRLAAEAEFPNIFLSWGFNRAWWRAFGEKKILRTVVVNDQSGKVRLIAPFYAPENDPLSWRMISDFSGDYNDILVKAGDVESLSSLFSWLSRQPSWQEITIGRIPSTTLPELFPHTRHCDSTPIQKIRAWLALGSPLVYRVWNFEHPYVTGSKLQAMRNLVNTKNYIRHVNWYRRNGQFHYRTVISADEIRTLLPEFMELHTREWTGKGRSAQFKWILARKFFEFMVEDMAQYGSLRMNLLQYNGAMVAAHFGFQGQGRFYFYKPCIDLEHAKHSPGKVLMAYMIQQAIDEGITDFDLLRGLDPYKERYTSDMRRTAFLFIQRSRMILVLRKLGLRL